MRTVQEWLKGWEEGTWQELVPEDSSEERICRIFEALDTQPNSVGWLDVAGLILHRLRQTNAHDGSAGDERISVPQDLGWPNRQQWEKCGADLLPLSSPKTFNLRAPTRGPEWLNGKAPGFLEDVFGQARRRDTSDGLDMDPGLAECLKFDTYRDTGQREAVRAALLLRPGGSLIVGLPTGSGKSLISHAPTLLRDSGHGLTVVVVPTVALAIDQEAEVLKAAKTASVRLEKPLAYSSEELSDDEKLLVKRRIENGSQRIVFASPESIVKGLASSLFEAAKLGFLEYFVIDEAHVVSQWGDEFRPEFQAMSGLRRSLLQECPEKRKFRTIMMTATLTEECNRTLQGLFGPGPFSFISAIHLRPEPEFWVSHAADDNQKRERLLELVRYVPRPFIFYVTKREDADWWLDSIRREGMLRVDKIHGRSGSRARAIDKWRLRELDGMVATSAFGLGVNQADVRTVIHACVPETVDRYYQEIGRGGRDGKASAALMVYTSSDLVTAKTVARKTIIGNEKGFERWNYMHRERYPRVGDEFTVSLDSLPPQLARDSERNQEWNLRTLVLMARAGLIGFLASPRPRLEQGANESDSEFDDRRERFWVEKKVKVHVGDSKVKESWEEKVSFERKLGESYAEKAQERRDRLLNGDEEYADIFSETYSFDFDDIDATPMHACGGCPVCRPDLRYQQHPSPDVVGRIDLAELSRTDKLKDRLRKLVGLEDAEFFYACYDPEARNWRRDTTDLLAELVSVGVCHFGTNAEWLRDPEGRFWRNLVSNKKFVAVSKIRDLLVSTPLLTESATVVVLDKGPTSMTALKRVHETSSPILVIVADENTKVEEGRLLKDVLGARYLSVQDLLRRLRYR